MIHVSPSNRYPNMSPPDAYWLLYEGHVLSLNRNMKTKLAIKKAIKTYKKHPLSRVFIPPNEFYIPNRSHILICKICWTLIHLQLWQLYYVKIFLELWLLVYLFKVF